MTGSTAHLLPQLARDRIADRVGRAPRRAERPSASRRRLAAVLRRVAGALDGAFDGAFDPGPAATRHPAPAPMSGRRDAQPRPT